MLPDFNDIIKQYDLLFFCETKLDEYDVLDLPEGYSYFLKNRQKFERKSGGIAIIFRKELEKYIHFLQNECEYVQWMCLSKEISCVKNESLLVGCIYIPPEQSRYSSDEAFNELEDELITFSKNYKHVSLVGDFNSKTSTLDDFIVPDEDLINVLDFDDSDEFLQELYDFENLNRYGVSLKRFSEDKNRPNKYGHKLIEMCQNCSIYIVNSRRGNDKGIGRRTCKDSSIVDYVIVSSRLFTVISEFDVIDFDPLVIRCA